MGKGKGKKVRADASKYDIELFGRQNRIDCRVIWNCPTASHCMPSSTVFSPPLGVESPSVVFLPDVFPLYPCFALPGGIGNPSSGRREKSSVTDKPALAGKTSGRSSTSRPRQGKQVDGYGQLIPAGKR